MVFSKLEPGFLGAWSLYLLLRYSRPALRHSAQQRTATPRKESLSSTGDLRRYLWFVVRLKGPTLSISDRAGSGGRRNDLRK
jgi:hypothetical protein